MDRPLTKQLSNLPDWLLPSWQVQISSRVALTVEASGFVTNKDMNDLLQINHGHGGIIIFRCPLGHWVQPQQPEEEEEEQQTQMQSRGGSANMGRYCNLCLDELANLASFGPSRFCSQCGFAMCGPCVAKQLWMHSLFPPRGRTWMQLIMEGLARRGDMMDFEHFKNFWLGQVYKKYRQFNKRQGLALRVRRLYHKFKCCQWQPRCCIKFFDRFIGKKQDDTVDLLRHTENNRRTMQAIAEIELQETSQLSCTEASSSGSQLKLMIFDFDLTLAGVHVFYNLVGRQIPATSGQTIHHTGPFAATEHGQLRLLNELGPEFSFKALGGPPRVAMLRDTLNELKDLGVRMMIVSKGNVGACRKILRDTGLLNYFERVYGNLGDLYGICSDFDRDSQPDVWEPTAEDEELLGTEDCGYQAGKADLIAGLKDELKLAFAEVLFTDDDPNEINLVKSVCRVRQVSSPPGMQPCGLTAEDLRYIEEVANGTNGTGLSPA